MALSDIGPSTKLLPVDCYNTAEGRLKGTANLLYLKTYFIEAVTGRSKFSQDYNGVTMFITTLFSCKR